MSLPYRLRIFAGPNGSGKSTLFANISARYDCGVFVNADEIKRTLDETPLLDVQNRYGVELNQVQLHTELQASPSLIKKSFDAGEKIHVKVENGAIISRSSNRKGYEAAFLAQLIRARLMESRKSFSYESVFSDKGKLREVEVAKAMGFRIYLYFVCLDSPELNQVRVEDRVRKEGHYVPPEKILERYYRSLANLPAVAGLCNRCYFFDNSGADMVLLAELDEGEFISHDDLAPSWFEKYFLKPVGLI